jgi:3-oxoacyl-[acyl-carrier-protein] synthase II
MKRRIVVTGMGIVSCFGSDVETFYESLLQGKSGVSPIDKFPCEDFPTRFAAWIKDFNSEGYLDKKQARRVDPSIAYAIVAGKKALESAGIEGPELDPHKVGVLIGSGMGGMGVFTEGVNTLRDGGPKRVSPFLIPFILTNMGGAMLAMDKGFMGPNYSISTACATANYAIIAAAEHIRRGDADVMIAGGVEASIIPMAVAGFNACKALSCRNEAPEKASRPWDKGRDGFVMGEGCGVIVLEEYEHAKRRGATIIAEYAGGGLSCDAHHITEPRQDGEGVAMCIRAALKDAGATPEEVDYINAHATSTPAGDMAEVDALRKVFKNPKKITMNGTKSMIGHCLGAAGGLEAIATLMAIKTKEVHPTINLDNPEEGLDFDIPTQRKKVDINLAISNSFGFGGHNATVAFKRFQG